MYHSNTIVENQRCFGPFGQFVTLCGLSGCVVSGNITFVFKYIIEQSDLSKGTYTRTSYQQKLLGFRRQLISGDKLRV